MSSITPCDPWEVIWCQNCDISTASPVLTGHAVQWATNVLWARTGRQFGQCTVENLRPCKRACGEMVNSPWNGDFVRPVHYNGRWFNLTCASCAGECSCSRLEEFILPGYVDSIVEIVIDGTPLATGSYRLDDHRRVVRTDGFTWPICQDLSADSDADGAWSVSAVFGPAPPMPDAGFAVGELALEAIKACTGDASCALPRRLIERLSRQGVDYTFTASEDLENGLLGLYFCDELIRTYNPNGLQSPAMVYSPDSPPIRHAGR